MALTDEQIVKLRDMAANSTNELARKTAKEKLEAAGISLSDEPEVKPEKEKKEPKPKKEKPVTAKKEPKAKSTKKEDETFEVKGKKYSKEDCDELYKGFAAKQKNAKEAVKKSENKHTTTKVADKMEVIVKQVIDDPKVQAKLESKPGETKKKITVFKNAIKTMFKSVEALIDSKISDAKMDKIFAILEEED